MRFTFQNLVELLEVFRRIVEIKLLDCVCFLHHCLLALLCVCYTSLTKGTFHNKSIHQAAKSHWSNVEYFIVRGIRNGSIRNITQLGGVASHFSIVNVQCLGVVCLCSPIEEMGKGRIILNQRNETIDWNAFVCSVEIQDRQKKKKNVKSTCSHWEHYIG